MKPYLDNVQQAASLPMTAVVTSGPHLNALKHGRRAAAVLLPGENAAEFQRMLQEKYELHRPRTCSEARCVDKMADYDWCMDRNSRMRGYYHQKLLALQSGDPAAAPHCEHDPHRWHHQAQDCTREERRLSKLRTEAVEELELLQKLRRQNLVADATAAAVRAENGAVLPAPALTASVPDGLPAGIGTAPETASTGKKSAVPGSLDGRKFKKFRTDRRLDSKGNRTRHIHASGDTVGRAGG